MHLFALGGHRAACTMKNKRGIDKKMKQAKTTDKAMHKQAPAIDNTMCKSRGFASRWVQIVARERLAALCRAPPWKIQPGMA